VTGAERDEFEAYMRGRARELRRRTAMGDAASDLRSMPLPGSLERYLATGAPMPAWKRGLGAMAAQVPRVGYGVGALRAFFFASRAYQRWRDEK